MIYVISKNVFMNGVCVNKCVNDYDGFNAVTSRVTRMSRVNVACPGARAWSKMSVFHFNQKQPFFLERWERHASQRKVFPQNVDICPKKSFFFLDVTVYILLQLFVRLRFRAIFFRQTPLFAKFL